MKGIFGRILLVAGVMGIAHQACLLVSPQWFTRTMVVPLAEFDAQTRTASYSSSALSLDIQVDLEQLKPGPEDALLIQANGEEREVLAEPGREVAIASEPYTITAVQRWQGLLPDPQGEPMVQIALREEGGEWVEGIQLTARSEATVGELSVVFDPDAGDSSGVRKPRWGIVDDGSVIWFNDIVEGAGYETSDGTVYTLGGFREDYGEPPLPAIVVFAERAGSDPERHLVTPESEHPVIRLDVPEPDALELVLRLAQDGAVSVETYEGATASGTDTLEIGRWAAVTSAPRYGIRVDQALASAVPVGDDEMIFEVVLESDTRRLSVRQGEAVRVGDTVLRYRLDASGAEVSYAIRSTALDGPIVLESDTAWFEVATEIGRYRAQPGAARRGEALQVQFTPFASVGVVIASIFMLISGSAFTVIRYRELSSDQ